MEKKQFTELDPAAPEILHEMAGQEQSRADLGTEKKPTEKETQTIIVKMDESREEDGIDLLSTISNMGKRWKIFRYLLILAVCVGFLIAAAITGIRGIAGGGSYASAVVAFSFQGIDEGLDPNQGLFDVNKLKSTLVINNALKDLGFTEINVEEIRSNIKLEGVIPDSVKQQIAVINTVAEDAAEYYVNIEDLDYFPSRYTVTLQRCKGMSGSETRELLDAILLSYREFFMDSYADISVLGTAISVLDVETYDYLQAADMIENSIDTMQAYVNAKQEEAPDYRANATGLSFSDLANSIDSIKQLDLNNFISFVQSNNLTKDAGVQIDYYNYQISQYNLEIQELHSQLTDVETTIKNYEKDPVIVMSNQDSVAQTTQKNEYYDTLLKKKLELNEKISALNTEMNKSYAITLSLNNNTQTTNQEDYTYVDSLLKGLVDTVDTWSGLVQKTAEEYYATNKYASAYRISIPAQYTSVGGVGELVKLFLICGGIGAILVFVFWGIYGVREELKRIRKNETYTDHIFDLD